MKMQNLTVIDDLLIAAGGLGLPLSGSIVYGQWATIGRLEGTVGYLSLSLIPACITLLVFGLIVRHQEKTTLRLWALLQHTPDARLSTLLQQSGFTLQDIRRGVRSLNNAGIGHYILNEHADRLYDGRLNARMSLRHECAGCGATTELTVNLQEQDELACSYCLTPFQVDSINRMRHQQRQAIAGEIARHTSSRLMHLAGQESTRKAPRFSMSVLLVLMVLFWPGALFYVIRYLLSRRRHEALY
ncbi:hypothetical protein ACUNV4_02400 [Granulosicoccus sp. 3-233]|uniref:hypothetical protein n=1 Tax=Granulosicoccus sp. 3-233 TaxID=3417969 RepID=UPI003D34357B